MYLSNQSLLVIIVVGLVAGWLAGRVMEGGGFGLIGDLLIGLHLLATGWCRNLVSTSAQGSLP